jgi:hypothetical protein
VRALLEGAGCELVRTTYLNTFLFPVAWAVRTWQQLRKRLSGPPDHAPRTDFVDYHPVVNALLTVVFTAETPLVTTTGLPFGLSYLVLGRKREVTS